MVIRIGSGNRAAQDETPRDGLTGMGLLILAISLGLAWVANREGLDDLRLIALVMAGSGGWIAGLHRVVRRRASGRAIVGGLFSGWAAVGAVAAALDRQWILVLPCAVLLVVGLLVLGVIPLPAWARSALATVRRFGFGLAFMGAGLAIVAGSLGGATSEGVPPSVGVAAGAVFFLAGAATAFHEGSGGRDTVLTRTLVALLVTGLTTVTLVLPPLPRALALLAMGPFTALAWIAVGRRVIERRTGHDPLGTWSDQRVLGLGCGATLSIGVLVLGLLQARSCFQQPRERPPAEAVGPP